MADISETVIPSSAVLKKARALASDGSLKTWPYEYRMAYGAAVEKAILSAQRAELAAWPAKVRRNRSPHEWKSMYRAAMPADFVPSWEKETES